MIDRYGVYAANYPFTTERLEEHGRWCKAEDVEKLEKLLKALQLFVKLSPCDPDIYRDQLAAWQQYEKLLYDKA